MPEEVVIVSGARIGGYGYRDEYDIHRHWRDARLLTIGEGTSEILRLLIAHLALKE